MLYYIEDTNVISNATHGDDLSDVAKPGTNRFQLEVKRRELEKQDFRHAITPVLLIELITGLAKQHSSVDQFVNFHKTKNKFRILYPWGDQPVPTMLPSPNAFVLKKSLNIDSPKAASLNEIDFSRWVDIVFCARSPEELWTNGTQIDPKDSRSHTIDRTSVRYRYDEEQRLHRHIMAAAKQGSASALTEDEFARSIFKCEGILSPNPEEIEAVSKAVEAAYRYHAWLFQQASTGYNFESPKHKGDAMDYAYLLYLADPGVRFLTHDAAIKKRVGDCRQQEQIIVLPNLAKAATV